MPETIYLCYDCLELDGNERELKQRYDEGAKVIARRCAIHELVRKLMPARIFLWPDFRDSDDNNQID